ncbi:MAG: YbjN domain-containing protein [Pseudomonadota bacterium]
MKSLVLAAAALAGVAAAGMAPASAQAEALRTSTKIRNPSAPLTSLHAEALIPIVSQLGHKYEGVMLPGGEKALLVETDAGARFQITPMACDPSGRCRGMHMVSMFQTEVDRRTVMAFNDRYAFVSAGMSSDELAYLARYEIADYGLPRGNIAVSINVFLETANLFAEHLARATGDLKQAPQASDLAANGLNTQGLMKSVSLHSGGDVPESVAAHPHAMSFEVTNGIVETYVRAEQVYPGRIVNHIGN